MGLLKNIIVRAWIGMEPGKLIRGYHIFQGTGEHSLKEEGNNEDRQGADAGYIRI